MPDPRSKTEPESASRLLAATAPFSALPAEARAALSASPRIALDRAEMLFSAGDPAEAVYVIISGEIALEIDGSDGKSICVSSLGTGGVFGELAILDGQSRSVAARAAAR